MQPEAEVRVGQILGLGHSDTVWPMGTLRGMPYQLAPSAEGKLVRNASCRCTSAAKLRSTAEAQSSPCSMTENGMLYIGFPGCN